MDAQKNSPLIENRSEIYELCMEIFQHPSKFSLRLIRSRFREVELSESEKTLLNTLLSYFGYQIRHRRSYTQFQGVLIDSLINLLTRCEFSQDFNEVHDYLNTILDLWETVGCDDDLDEGRGV